MLYRKKLFWIFYHFLLQNAWFLVSHFLVFLVCFPREKFLVFKFLIPRFSSRNKQAYLHVSRAQIDSVKETSLNNLIPFSSFHLFGNGSHSFFQLVTSYLGSLQNRKNTPCTKIDKKCFNLVFSMQLVSKRLRIQHFFLYISR